MSSEATMTELEVLCCDLERIGKSRVREEAEAVICQEKERQVELITSHLQEVAELVRRHGELLKCSEACEKELRNKIRITSEILTNASDPPVDGDDVCSEASTSYASAGQCEDVKSSDVDSELFDNRIEIAKGGRNIAQQDQDIYRLAFNLFSTTMRQSYHIQTNARTNDYIDKSWTELSPEQKRKWCEIATAVQKLTTLENSLMAPGFEESKVSTPRCEEESPNWREDKARRGERGRDPGERARHWKNWNPPPHCLLAVLLFYTEFW